MAEQINLANPITKPATNSVKVMYLALDRRNQRITVEVQGDDGTNITRVYEGDIAMTLINQINKSNNSVKTMERRILERLISDNVFTGTISGAPD